MGVPRDSKCLRHAFRCRAHRCDKKTKSADKRKSPATREEYPTRSKARASVVWGHAKSPGGTEHTYIANSGITPDGCGDSGKAVLRGAMKHQGKPGHSETSPAMVSDSAVQPSVSPVKMGK